MAIHVTPIPKLTEFATPALTLTTANAAGAAETTIRTDASILAYDLVAPPVISQASAVGSAVVASRRDHTHGLVGSVPLVVAYNNAAQANVTGDGTDATIQFNAELVDQGDNFTGNTFTAPVTGNYQLSLIVRYEGLASNNTYGYIYIKSTLRNFLFDLGNPWAQSNAGEMSTSVSQLVPMTAGNTVYATLKVYGGSKVVDVGGDGTTMLTALSVALVG